MSDQQQLTWEGLQGQIAGVAGPVFIVCGKTSYLKSGAKTKLDQALGCQQSVVFNDFNPNPQLSEIQKGIEAFHKAKPGLIVAVGGGSAIDVAKGIQSLSTLDPVDYQDALKKPADYNQDQIVDLIAVPTTFGTGSESTHFATVYVGAEKFSLAGPNCLPTAYLLDEELGLSASPYIKASCGMDALCQAIESFWAVGATDESRTYAARAIELLLPGLESFVSGTNEKEAGNVALGANLAGKAINISKTTAPHAISYGVTQKFGIEHGQAVFLSLPFFFKQNAENDTSGRMAELIKLMGAASAMQAVDQLLDLANQIGLKSKLGEIAQVGPDDLNEIADGVNLERLGNHPFAVSHEEIVTALS